MKKYLTTRNCVLATLILLTLAFIFSRSLRDIPDSKEESRQVMSFLLPVLEFFFGAGNVTVNLVRKLAHLVEFGVLGFEVGLLTARFRTEPFLFCLVAALTDETIQIFTGRGPQIQDVWLDFAGAVAGILVGAAAMWLWKTIRKSKKTDATAR